MVGDLHETVRGFDASLPSAEQILDAYFAYLWSRCEETRGGFYLAEADGAPAGYLCLFARVVPSEPDQVEPHAFVSDLYVAPEFHRRGIGDALIRVAEEAARAQGVARLELSVLARNAPALQFYRKLGFAERAVIMSKPLS
ncbi:MAG: GNAT family N-acetyltransferase [Armatimonadetes bacterium]|nr:GNAT family N-acetyltransferase [Armatimonadota bacterium]